MINDGFHRGFGSLGGRTCNRREIRKKKKKKRGVTHWPCNRTGINERDGLSADNVCDICKVRSAASNSSFIHIFPHCWDHCLIKWTSLFVSAPPPPSHPLSRSVKLMLQLGHGPPARLSLQLVYPHRGLKYAPLSEPPRWENERDVSP